MIRLNELAIRRIYSSPELIDDEKTPNKPKKEFLEKFIKIMKKQKTITRKEMLKISGLSIDAVSKTSEMLISKGRVITFSKMVGRRAQTVYKWVG